MDLTERDRKWPVGDPRDRFSGFCGLPVQAKASPIARPTLCRVSSRWSARAGRAAKPQRTSEPKRKGQTSDVWPCFVIRTVREGFSFFFFF